MDVFVHVPKSSGSTIRSILSRQYGVDQILYFEPDSSGWVGSQTPRQFVNEAIEKRGIKLLTGHYPFGVHLLTHKPSRYFSMVRDPIDRALSDYYYAFSYPHHRFRERIVSGQVSAEAYVTHKSYSPGGAQAAMIAGRARTSGGLVKTALQTIEHSFISVGITERFEESIMQFAKLLGWRPPLFIQRNVTQLQEGVSKERADVRFRVLNNYPDYFREDYEVYGEANKMLTAWIASEGEPYARALEAFREIQQDIASHTTEEVFERYEFGHDDALPPFATRYAGSDTLKTIDEYLKSPTESRPKTNFIGTVDAYGGTEITGWAADLLDDKPIHVTLRRHGRPCATALCNRPRPDLAEAGLDGSFGGFVIELEKPMEKPSEYVVCFEDTSFELTWHKKL